MAKRNGGQCIIAFNYVRQGQGCSYISDIRFGSGGRGPLLNRNCMRVFDYIKYPMEEFEKLHEYPFGETVVFCEHIGEKRKFLRVAKI